MTIIDKIMMGANKDFFRLFYDVELLLKIAGKNVNMRCLFLAFWSFFSPTVGAAKQLYIPVHVISICFQ